MNEYCVVSRGRCGTCVGLRIQIRIEMGIMGIVGRLDQGRGKTKTGGSCPHLVGLNFDFAEFWLCFNCTSKHGKKSDGMMIYICMYN